MLFAQYKNIILIIITYIFFTRYRVCISKNIFIFYVSSRIKSQDPHDVVDTHEIMFDQFGYP